MNTPHSLETHVDGAPALLRLAFTAQTFPTSATLAINEAVAKQRAAGHKIIYEKHRTER